ncbi:sulfotransferase [Glaciecola sp. MH2013]|uniref:tetratricopeptide repeat-containing sulfotransferase family protein n=1 Tax=Glaciecola sp. MH2013 TaxID=2785524 RepID=UPI00189FC5E7|nr:sulfotransferase family protein [Glaciecola sp. MH2013]MBF7073085.1 sulfotransferase [Glaciecola sp. MH2013]
MAQELTWQQALDAAYSAFDKSDYKSAYSLFSQLLRAKPNNGSVHLGFGKLLAQLEEFDQAIQHISNACKLLPQRFDCLLELAHLFDLVHSQKDVKTTLEFALDQFPNEVEVIYHLATFDKETGNFQRALTLSQKALTLLRLEELDKQEISGIENGQHVINLALHFYLLQLSLPLKQDYEAMCEALLSLIKHVRVDDNKMLLNYALGNVEEKRQHFAQAFDYWYHANQYQRGLCSLSTGELAPFFNSIKNLRSNEHQLPTAEEQPSENFCPIFILGLPRTGSTLLEQLLCEFEDVDSLGEEPILAKHCAGYLAHTLQQPFPEFITNIKQEDARTAANIYINALRKRQLNSSFVIDKLPSNFQSIDLIVALFPNAKIVHIRREFKDTAISIFKNYFAENEPYFCDLQELDIYRAHYEDLMAHFHNKYPRAIFDINYEALVRDPHANIQALINFCGIKTKKAQQKSELNSLTRIKTLSSTQAIAPVSAGSIGSYKNYEEQLRHAGLL